MLLYSLVDLVTKDDLSPEAMLESSQRIDALAATYRYPTLPIVRQLIIMLWIKVPPPPPIQLKPFFRKNHRLTGHTNRKIRFYKTIYGYNLGAFYVAFGDTWQNIPPPPNMISTLYTKKCITTNTWKCNTNNTYKYGNNFFDM